MTYKTQRVVCLYCEHAQKILMPDGTDDNNFMSLFLRIYGIDDVKCPKCGMRTMIEEDED